MLPKLFTMGFVGVIGFSFDISITLLSNQFSHISPALQNIQPIPISHLETKSIVNQTACGTISGTGNTYYNHLFQHFSLLL